MGGVNGAGVSVLGTKVGVSNSNRVGEKGIPKKGQAFASFDDEGKGVAQGTNNDIVSVCNGAAVAISEELFSDQKRSNQDLVGSKSCKRGDPKNVSSWDSIVGASSDEDENTSISFRSETAGADKVFPAVAGATDNNEGQSKLISAVGKVWSADIAGSGVRKKVPARAWVKCLRKTSPTGPDLSSGIEEPASTVNHTRKFAGRIVDSIHTTSDQMSSTPQRLDLGPSEG